MQLNNKLIKKITPPYSFIKFVNGTGNITTNSTSMVYIDSTNGKATINVQNGKMIIIDLTIGGLWITNTGYTPVFDIGLDGVTTKSTSGEKEISPASVIGNMISDGSGRVEVARRFYFVNITPGNHTFYALWRSNNSGATATIGQYAQCYINVREII